MNYQVLLEPAATNGAAGFLSHDPDGLRALLDALDDLSEDPRPAASSELGSPDLRRLWVGRFRAMYEIDDATQVVRVLNVGRVY